MSAFWALTWSEFGMMSPVERFGFADWLALQSVKLQYMCLYLYDLWCGGGGGDTEQAGDNHPQPKRRRPRVLLFTEWPTVHRIPVTFLRMIMMKTLFLRSKMDTAEKRQAIRDFNGPDAEFDLMVASIQYATGLNLHKACSHMVPIEVSLSTLPGLYMTIISISMSTLSPTCEQHVCADKRRNFTEPLMREITPPTVPG